MSSFYLFAEAEVSELDVALLVDHNVLGFEVSVDHVLAMHVVKSKDYLRDVELGSKLGGGNTVLLRTFI